MDDFIEKNEECTAAESTEEEKIREESTAAEVINMKSIADSAIDFISPGKIIQGEVVTTDDEFVYVNVGTKSDGRVESEEFETKPEIGDVIDIILINNRLIDGMYAFSKTAADKEKRWAKFVNLYKEGNSTISGEIVVGVKNGMIVNCDGLNTFLPFSLAADMKMKKILETDSKETYFFKIKNIDEEKKTIIVSRKDYLEEEKEKFWDSFISNYSVGDRIKGKVVEFVEFGVFISLGGIDALLHKNDMSWRKIFKQKKLLKDGEEREFVILNINRDDHKISLGLKQLTEDPWLKVDERHQSGDKVSGKVVTLTNSGVFVEIEEGIEGFIGLSDISWTKRNVNPKDVFHKGQNIDVEILNVNKEERKFTLGFKQLLQNPWDTIEKDFPINSIHKGKIKKILGFGMFVEIKDDIDGLIHVSDISWDENLKDPHTLYKEGREVEFMILDIKLNEMKVACGIKQLTKSPWEVVKEKYPPNSRVSGVVSRIVPFGLFVKLNNKVEGLVHISEVSQKKIDNLENEFRVSDSVQAIVLGVDVDRKRVSLSIKRFDKVMEKEELNKILNEASPRKATIGDFIKIDLRK